MMYFERDTSGYLFIIIIIAIIIITIFYPFLQFIQQLLISNNPNVLTVDKWSKVRMPAKLFQCSLTTVRDVSTCTQN